MKKENTITNNPAKVAKTEKIIKKLETFLKTNSGQKFVNYVHKERIDISTEVLPNFIGQIATFHNDVYHRDIGTIESYALSQVEILKIKLDKI